MRDDDLIETDYLDDIPLVSKLFFNKMYFMKDDLN